MDSLSSADNETGRSGTIFRDRHDLPDICTSSTSPLKFRAAARMSISRIDLIVPRMAFSCRPAVQGTGFSRKLVNFHPAAQ
jgi:hypothetical protein